MSATDVDIRRATQLAFIARKRERCLAYLGGSCVRCGTTEELEFDHIDSTKKSFTISSSLSRRWEVLVEELDKCQLLCKFHHREKTIECGEQGGGQNKLAECPHGTLWGYMGPWKCRCEPCKAVKRASYRPKPSKLNG